MKMPPSSVQARAAAGSKASVTNVADRTEPVPPRQAIPFPTWRRPGWLERKLTARRLAEALERLPAHFAEVEARR